MADRKRERETGKVLGEKSLQDGRKKQKVP